MQYLTFGVEIEVVGIAKAQIARAIHSVVASPDARIPDYTYSECNVKDTAGRIWKVVDDGSLSDHYQSGEIVTPILGYEDIDLLRRVVAAVADRGARADHSTGIHIHVGASDFDAASLARLVKMVHKQERLLEHALGITEQRLQRYCKSVEEDFMRRVELQRPKTVEAMSAAWYGQRGVVPQRRHESRYHGLNLNSFYYRGTIEYRYFNGTVDADKVIAYLHLVLAMTDKALISKAASSKRRAFNEATAKYDWRVFLLSLGLIGPEFRKTRRHLTSHLAGSAAWKGERRDRRQPSGDQDQAAVPEAGAAPASEEGSGE